MILSGLSQFPGGIAALFERLTAPAVQDASERQQARLLAALSLMLTGVVALVLLMQLTLFPGDPQQYIMICVFLLGVLAVQYAISRTRYYRLSGFCMIFTVFIIVPVTIYAVPGNADTPVVVLYLSTAVMISSLVFSLRFTVLLALLGTAMTIFILAAQNMLGTALVNILYANVILFILFILSALLRKHTRDQLREQAAALEHERSLLRRVLDTVPDSLYVKDAESRFLLANQQVLRRYNLASMEDIIGKTDEDLLDHWQETLATEREIMTTGVPMLDREFHHYEPDGSERWIRITKVPFHDSQGRVLGVIGINRDISAQKRSEIELKRERNMLLTILDTVPDQVYVKDLEGRFTMANNTLLEQHGMERLDQIVGKTDSDLGSDTDVPLAESMERDLFHQGKAIINFEFNWYNEHIGREMWLLITKVPLRDADGNIIGLVGINRDITERKQIQDRMEYERTLLQSIIEGVPDQIYVKDRESRFILVNQAVLNRHDVPTRDALIGKTDTDLLGEPLASSYRAQERRLMDTGEPVINLEVRYRKHGRDYLNLINKFPLRDSDGKIIGLIGINRDITERKEMENRLQYERNLLHTIIENIPDPVYVKDTEGRFLIVNRAALAQHHMTSPDEMIGKTDADIDPSPNDVRIAQTMEQAILEKGESVIDFEFSWYDRRLGTQVWMLINKVPLRDAAGNIIGLIGINRDITRRKVAEEAVRHERNQLRTMIEHLPDSVYVKDRDSRFLMANRPCWEFAGYSSEAELVGKTDMDFHPPERARQLKAEEEQVINTGIPLMNHEVEATNYHGERVVVLVTKVPLRDTAGNIIGLVGMNRNITDRKQAEETLQAERNLLRTIIEHIPDSVYVKDRQGRFILVNKICCWENNVDSEAEILGKTDFDFFVSPQEAQPFWDEEQRIMATGESILNQETEDWFMGRRYVMLITKVPLRDTHGEIVGILGLNRYITEYRDNERALREERNLLRAILESTPDSVYVKDQESRFILVNAACAKINGFSSPEEIIGKTDLDIFGEEVGRLAYISERQIIENGEAIVNLEVDAPDLLRGTRLVQLITKLPLYDTAGNITGLIGMNRDITDYKRAQEAMHALTAELEQQAWIMDEVLSNTPDQINMHDREGRFTYSNTSALAMVGLTRDQVIGKTWRDLGFPPATGAAFENSLKRVFEQGETVISENEFPTVMGIRYFETILSPIHNLYGEVIAAVNTIRDITDRRLTENKLLEERNLLRTLIDNIPQAVYVKDREHRFMLANTVCWREAGLGSMEEIIGQTDMDIMPHEIAQEYVAEEIDLLESGEPMLNKERDTFNPRGQHRVLIVSKFPLYDASGQVSGLVGVNLDITELKEVQIEQRYQASLMANITDAVIATDLNFRIRSWNTGAEMLYGWKAEEVLGQSLSEILPIQSDNPDIEDELTTNFMTHHQWKGEVLHPHKNGHLIHVFSSVSLVRGPDGTPIGSVGINHDITPQKTAEAQRMQLTLEQERVNILRRFISDMSHDLRNPLAALKISLYLLSKTFHNPERREHHFGVMNTYVERLESMLEDLLSMSRLDHDRTEFNFAMQDISALMQNVVREQQPLAEGRDQTLTFELEPDLPSVVCDSSMITRAVTNLIVNAIRYTPVGGNIIVRMYRQEEQVAIAVQDSGIGISPADLKNIFERFFRADPARQTDTGGTGLGLSIARRIVDAHQGRIEVESELGIGSTFTIILPLVHQVRLP